MYSETERQVFPYFDGVRERYGDPLAIDRRLRSLLGGEVGTWIDRYNRADPEAEERVLGAAREALDMAPFDPDTGGGALDADAEAALRSFLEWREGKGLRGGKSPTSSPPTPDSPPPSTRPASITWGSSAFPSTPTGVTPAGPG